jgi:hypothetical protein
MAVASRTQLKYNGEQPRRSLDDRTPTEFKLALEASRAMPWLASPTTADRPWYF